MSFRNHYSRVLFVCLEPTRILKGTILVVVIVALNGKTSLTFIMFVFKLCFVLVVISTLQLLGYCLRYYTLTASFIVCFFLRKCKKYGSLLRSGCQLSDKHSSSATKLRLLVYLHKVYYLHPNTHLLTAFSTFQQHFQKLPFE